MTILQFIGLVVYMLVGYGIWRGLWAVSSWATPNDEPVDWRDQVWAVIVSIFWPIFVAGLILDMGLNWLPRWAVRAFSRLKGRGQ